MDDQPTHKKMTFDPTINLGHVLTFLGFLATGFAVHSSLDKRILVLETNLEHQKMVDSNQDERTQFHLDEIRRSLNEIKGSVKELNNKFDKRKR